jgi:hypothetical protein
MLCEHRIVNGKGSQAYDPCDHNALLLLLCLLEASSNAGMLDAGQAVWCRRGTMLHGQGDAGGAPHSPPPVQAGLDQWEREVQVFYRMKSLKLFRLYKMWKAFHTWRKAVRTLKIATATKALQKSLFLLIPAFQGHLVAFHGLCHQLSGMRLHNLQPGRVGASYGWLNGACLRDRHPRWPTQST